MKNKPKKKESVLLQKRKIKLLDLKKVNERLQDNTPNSPQYEAQSELEDLVMQKPLSVRYEGRFRIEMNSI